MKKTLLLFFLFIINGIYAQAPFQPQQFNSVCDDNNDGFVSFFMEEISYEIMGNEQNLVVTHHLTQADAANGVNPLPSDYTNISNPQLIFARVVNSTTNAVQIITYNLTVNPTPLVDYQELATCETNGVPSYDLSGVPAMFSENNPSYIVTIHETSFDANMGTNAIPATVYTSLAGQQELFIRVESTAGCYSISYLFLNSVPCENPNCPAPTNVQVSNVTANSAVLSWESSSLQQSLEIYIDGTLLTSGALTSPFTFTGLQCNHYYSIELKSICANNEISNVTYSYIYTNDCPQLSQPENYSACVETGTQACFNLFNNDSVILQYLNPADYTISYHTTESNATYNINPITTNYCMTQGFHMIYARVLNNSSQAINVLQFSINVFDFQHINQSLEPIVQCDDNNDQQVVFDFTSITTSLNTGNTFAFYTNSNDAQNQQNAIANPAAYALSTQSNNAFTLFIRETVVEGCDNIYNVPVTATLNCNNASYCIEANSLCSALGVPFNNTTNATNINETGANYGCLNTHPNPTWFYLPVSEPGQINLMIQQNNSITFNGSNQDVDFIVYGPFTNPTTPCYGELTQNKIVDCSYSAAAIEYADIPNAQAGQYYLIMLTNFSNQPGFIRIVEVETTTAQINCNGMKLNAFLDTNNNGTQDNNEVNFPLGQFHYEMNNNGVVHDITSPTGKYNIYETNTANSYDLSYSIIPSYASMYAISTSSYADVSITNGAGMITYNFPVTIVQPYNDLAVTIIPYNAPRPGFIYQNKIVYGNLGNQPIASGTVTFEKDSAVSITSISQSGTTANATGFTYNFTNLLPFEYRTIDVFMQVPTIPTVTAGDYLDNTASIVPLTGDVVVENNESELSQMIVNAYDPNDKVESRGAEILHSTFTSEDYLYYTIRFENTGNASAINVRVNDVLNSQLDASTVRMISASHPYVLDQVQNNLTWNFDNIQLPVSVANTNIGKGYITFKIKPMPGYAVGDIIPNAASIYFDFNPAIVTNTFNTEFTAPLSTEDFSNSEFIIYPNPSNGLFIVSLKNKTTSIASISIFDVLGKTIYNKNNVNTFEENISISDIKSGVYIMELVTNEKVKISKKLIIK